jgi:DNA primase
VNAVADNWTQALTDFAAQQVTSQVREALWARGVSDEQIDLYKIGFLDRELPEGMPDRFAKWALSDDKLEATLLLPLTTTLGEIRGFQLRHVNRTRGGYSDYFVDRREACLFGLHQAVEAMWRTESVFLVEGGFDLFPVQRATPAVVATLTARTNGQMARILRRIVKRVWVGYDMDEAGRQGCEDFIREYGHEFEVYTVAYPRVNGKLMKDPGDLWEAWGDAQMVPFIKSVLTKDDIFS